MDKRVIGIVGGSLLVIGTFCPIITIKLDVPGLYEARSVSASFLGSARGTSWEGVLFLFCGIAAIVLAALRQNRFLLIPGLLSLALVVYRLLTLKSEIMSGFDEFGNPAMREKFENSISMSWGWIVLILGALVTIVAALLKAPAKPPPMPWGPPPPPYPPYPQQ